MRLSLKLLCAASVAFGSFTSTTTALDLGTPESAIVAPIGAIQANDLLTLYHALPAEDQARAVADWQKGKEQSPTQKAKMDEFFATMLAPDAVQKLLAEARPNLAQMNPQEMAAGIQMFGGMMAMQMAQKPEGKELGAQLQQLVMDLSAWIPTAGIENEKKLEQALIAVVSAVKALNVKNADEFFALSLEEFLGRAGTSLTEGKKAFAAYGVDVDAFLGSVKVIDLKGDGDKRSGKVEMTMFGHPYRLPISLVLKDGKWQLDQEAMKATVAPLQQMGGGMVDPADGGAPSM